MLTSREQNELHNLLRQQGSLTQDGCWDVIEVFEEFLKEKRKPLSEDDIQQLINTKHFASSYNLQEGDKVCLAWYRQGIKDSENYKIGETNE